jgi:ubiquinone/menaquinone biosynthesis C-methylase UbiE
VDPTIAANRAHWNTHSDTYQAQHDPAIGAAPRLWGAHAISDADLGAIGVVTGLDVLEYGCGAAQWAASLAADGAEVTAMDLSEVQLAHARQRSTELRLVQSAGQHLPFAAESFDLVFCDHGAMSWADPKETIPEARRVLRRGGRLVFNVTSPVLDMCWDDSVGGPGLTLRSDYFAEHRFVEGDGATSYTLTYGQWIRAFRANGLQVEDLIEPRPPESATSTYWKSEPRDWFTRWPGEAPWVTKRES